MSPVLFYLHSQDVAVNNTSVYIVYFQITVTKDAIIVVMETAVAMVVVPMTTVAREDATATKDRVVPATVVAIATPAVTMERRPAVAMVTKRMVTKATVTMEAVVAAMAT